MRRAICSAVILLLVGCENSSRDQAIPLEQVPAAMVKTAQEKLPQVKFEQAVRRGDGSYEIRGRDKQGKVRDVEMNAAGQVTEVE